MPHTKKKKFSVSHSIKGKKKKKPTKQPNKTKPAMAVPDSVYLLTNPSNLSTVHQSSGFVAKLRVILRISYFSCT